MTMTESATLPRAGDWDLGHFFSQFDGSDYRQAWKEYESGIGAATARAAALAPIAAATLDGWASAWLDWEALYELGTRLGTFLGCLRAADSKHEGVNQAYASLQGLGAESKKFDVILLDALRSCPDEAFAALLAHPKLETATFRLKRMREAAQFQMTAELETLSADLEVDGMSAWGRLYETVAGRLEFKLLDGKKVPMALKNSYLENADPAIRKAALVNSNQAWSEVEDVVASALNAIAGTRLTLYKRRGIKHFLDPALFDSAVSRKTLDAMMDAIRSRFEVARDYLRLKARLIGKTKLGFQDISCPLPLESSQEVSWGEAKERIGKVYAASYPHFGEFAETAFRDNWIDYQPRDGKRMGGFCTTLTNGESRIFMTYNQTLGDVQTLAHELGHAFHNHVIRDMRPLNVQYPMTLAETASTFAETLLTDAILSDPVTNLELKASMLDTRLEQASAFMLNIPMRYLFEKRFYEERAQGEVSVSRLKQLMLEAQRECYGDVLADDEMDPYFWASKLHFYITEVSFYNFPYSFGFLFSLGVYARALQEGSGFFQRYEDLLRLTGSDTAENVAKRSLGVDLEDQKFWLDSIATVEKDLASLKQITEQIFARG